MEDQKFIEADDLKGYREKKQLSEYDDEVKKLFSYFKFKDQELVLNGSYSSRNMVYYGDLDFVTQVDKSNDLYNDLKQIFTRLFNDHNNYFIELKLQMKDDQKIKIKLFNDFLKEDVITKHLDNLKFVKIDIVAYFDGYFKEASCIYNIGDASNYTDADEFKNDLKKDIAELKKDKNYFKMLKRMYSIARIEDDTKAKNMLTSFFNGEAGEMYYHISTLKAIDLLVTSPEFKSYPDSRKEDIKHKIEGVYKEFRITGKPLKKVIEKGEQMINEKAVEFIKAKKNVQ